MRSPDDGADPGLAVDLLVPDEHVGRAALAGHLETAIDVPLEKKNIY